MDLSLKSKRKGFFFTLLAVVFIMFIMIATSVWLATQKQSEERVTSKMESLALKQLAQQSTNEKIAAYVEFIGYRALLNLSNDTVTYAGGKIDAGETSNSRIFPSENDVKRELCSILQTGKRGVGSQPNFQLARAKDTLAYWNESMAKAAARQGLNFSFEVTDCRVQQNDAWHMNVQLDANVKISSRDGTLKLERSYSIRNSPPDPIIAQVSINGTMDPYITIMDYKNRKTLDNLQSVWDANVRFIYTSPYTLSELAQSVQDPKKLGEGLRGKGWAYGNITEDPGAGDIEPKKYILYTLNSDQYCHEDYTNRNQQFERFGKTLSYGQCNNEKLEQFVGVVLHGTPSVCDTSSRNDCPVPARVQSVGSCTCTYNIVSEVGQCFDCVARYQPAQVSGAGCAPSDCPSRADLGLENFVHANAITVPFVTDDAPSGNLQSTVIDNHQSILINAPTWCNLDAAGSHAKIWDIEKLRDHAICGYYLQNDAPTLLGRYSASSGRPSTGIESMLVGMWANDISSTKSKLDWVYYGSGANVKKIKGMPGCKTFETCKQASSTPLGHFALDEPHYIDGVSSSYELDEIRCDGNGASCEDNPGCT